jgi:hypothetical protein
MSINHKFLNTPIGQAGIVWNPNFGTNNAILSVTPYDPEVIIIGSFNHGWPWNNADFFYGRDMYMWTILANLFLYNTNNLTSRRNPPPNNNRPSLNQIFEICCRGKICFADVILGTNPLVNTIINNANETVDVNNGMYLWDNYGDSIINQMGNAGLLIENVENIVKFIRATPSIKHIYFTYNSNNWLVNKKTEILDAFPNISGSAIFTPTGMGFRKNLIPPLNNRAASLAHCWVWNGLIHTIAINKIGFGHFDHDWLIRNGVNPNNF